MKAHKTLFIILTLLAFNLQFAQNTQETQDKLSLDEGSIDSQFDFITTKSGNYRADGKRYEVVRVIHLNKLKTNVLDSLNAANKKESELKSLITTHETTINSLKDKLDQTSTQLASVTEEKDSMSFLGMGVSKGLYNLILWSIIGGLLLFLAMFIFKFRNSNVLTQESKSALSELEAEYEQHRRRALEREQKINRELQDERNKHKKKTT
ncbi:molybdopterin converting factor small subunit [Saonia flava]|uniref:Molybdopterin converting factor small subunit n=1 Tax=Saonia flava TaxID=523696 RepID=A0A846QVF3_9FLAO|nr:tRNA (guanine-N1)-methyltransferase [Saonia flava]NJB70552.1 molybdopterin converting factor small subunit [Saonia flava]